MAQRRSKNRRLSARRSNASGFLNEDTNVYDDNDPLWYDRTAVRPSTSVRMSKNTTAILDPDSTLRTSQLPDDWFEYLPQSDSSKCLEKAMKEQRSNQTEEQGDNEQRSVATESESEPEYRKKRANLRLVRKKSNKTNTSNAFMNALEKTTDSHVKNLTHAQMMEGNESESTHDDSRTIRKLRLKLTRRAKNDTNQFDKALESDSASERVETSRRSLRSSSKRISEVNEDLDTLETQQRSRRSTAEQIVDVSRGNKSGEKIRNKSINKSNNETTTETSVRELRNRNITMSPTKPAIAVRSAGKSSGTKKRSAKDQSTDVSFVSPDVKKHKRQLFSQGNKSTGEKSAGHTSVFDIAIDSANNSQKNEATMTEAVSTPVENESSDTLEDDDDTDISSIPPNIRRTRSRSLFGERNSGETGDIVISKSQSRTQDKNSYKDASQSSKDKSASNNQISATNKRATSLKNLIGESSNGEDPYSGSVTRSKALNQEQGDKSESAKLWVSSIETSDAEDMVDASPSKTKQSETNKSDKTESTKLQVSSNETSDDEDMVNMSNSRIEQGEALASKISNKSSVQTNPEKSRISKSTSSGDKEDDDSISPESSKRKSRSRFFQKKDSSIRENAFDQISFDKRSTLKDKSKEKEIEDTPKLSQRSPKATNMSHKNKSGNVSINLSTSRTSNKNDSKADESEDETSTIPQHIRRTRSRLFQKSKVDDGDNAFEDVLDAENVPETISESNQQSKTLNKHTNKSQSIIRDATTNSQPVKNKPKIIGNNVVRPAKSIDSLADSSKENQENRQSSIRRPVTNTGWNKENPINESQDAASDHRSVETSSDEVAVPEPPRKSSTPFVPSALPNKSLKRASMILGSAKSAQNNSFDDLIHTPNPAQSTLNPQGQPVNRITQFSFRTFGDLEEQTTPVANNTPKTGPTANVENDDVDVTGESDISDTPLISRQLNDIPRDEQEESPVVAKPPSKKNQHVGNNYADNSENASAFDWEKAKQHTDAVKMMIEAQMRLAEESRKKRELDKQRIDTKVKRLQAQRAAELKRKNKKPIDKAFLVDGKVYKQPKLPRPKSWATDKLYKYLWKCMEPKFGIRTRVKSEEFVLQLSDFATRIARRKKFENYSHELDEMMMVMAKLGIIETRYDFYRFTSDFMPYSFREKVNPMMLPGNKRNIPYDPELLDKPLLDESRNTRENDSDGS